MYTVYEELPMLLFLKIARDESKVHLLKNGEKASNKECRNLWEKFKDRWDEKHPSSDWVQQRMLYKKCLNTSTKLQKLRFFLAFISGCSLVPKEEVFEKAGIPYSKDLVKVKAKVEKLIEKESDKLLMASASLEKLKEELKDKQPLEKEETDFYEVIASLELATGQTYEHSKITIGEYEGRQKALEKKNRIIEAQNKKRNGKR
jgi:vacuolar-type H+-ATPase subunit I/STV1